MSDTISFMLKNSSAQMLGTLGHIMGKAEAHAKANDIDEAHFIGSRLTAGMYSFDKQVQTACDIAARGAARLAGAEMPSFPDEETSFAELIARTQAANAFVQKMDDAALNADPMSTVTLETPRGNFDFPKSMYMARFAVPNIYFHTSMAYGLLRQNGVEIGKLDFLTGGQMPA